MSQHYHLEPPKPEDYGSKEEYLDAVEAWESEEDDYVDDYLELRRIEREYN